MHFFTCAFLAAPASFLSAADFSHISAGSGALAWAGAAAAGVPPASVTHFFMKLFFAAPASFFSAAWASHLASAPDAWAVPAIRPSDNRAAVIRVFMVVSSS